MIDTRDGMLILEGVMEIYEDRQVELSPVVMVTIGNHRPIGEVIADHVGYKPTGVHHVVRKGNKKWRLTLESVD